MTRPIFTSCCLTLLGIFSSGCAVTDYTEAPAALVKSSDVISCGSSVGFDSTSSPGGFLEATQALLYADDGTFNPSLGAGQTDCSSGNPAVMPLTVSSADARLWNRCLSSYCFAYETIVTGTGPSAGTHGAAGIKDIGTPGTPDFRWRINSFYSPNAGTTCMAINCNPAAPEGAIVGDGSLLDPDTSCAPVNPRIADWTVETIALDDDPSTTALCSNIAAVSVNRLIGGFSSYLTLSGPCAGSLTAVPPCTPAAGLAEFAAGAPLSISVDGVRLTLQARIEKSGQIEVAVLGLESAGVAYQAKEPVRVRLDPSQPFLRLEVEPTQAELLLLAEWALDAGIADRTLALDGRLVPELLRVLPDVQIRIVGDTLRRFLEDPDSWYRDAEPDQGLPVLRPRDGSPGRVTGGGGRGG